MMIRENRLDLDRSNVVLRRPDQKRKEEGNVRQFSVLDTGTSKPDRKIESFLLHQIHSLNAVIRHLEKELELSRQKEARASHDAQHDVLTGLPNRLLLDLWLDRVLVAPTSEVRCVAMFIDMDRFKMVNDMHGHQVGDRLLKAAAQRIRKMAGKESLVVRYGGDEFVVLLPGLACRLAARRLAERFVAALCRPFDLDDVVVEIGASIGIAVAPAGGIEKQAFLRQADTALYAAKACGRGGVQVFQPVIMDGVLKA